MSNLLAIATVTAAIGETLKAAIEAAVSGAGITTRRPDASSGQQPGPRVNIYLYQVLPSAAWRNADLPTRRGDGTLVDRPQAALNLHYLLSFYGDETKLQPQRLLGATVRQLHAHPVLTPEQIRSVVQTNNDLAGSDLAEQPERVKLTPLALNLEELSKLWSVFFQTPYALSVAYEASVVLIEAEAKLQPALPVRERTVLVDTFRRPVIERVESADGPGTPIVSGSRVVLRGSQLAPADGDAQALAIRIDGETQPNLALDLHDTAVSFQLPHYPHLRAGSHAIQIVYHLQLGQPLAPHQGYTSNVATFDLLPKVSSVQFIAPNRYLVKFAPPVGRHQRVALLLHRINPNEGEPTYWILEAPPFDWPAVQQQTDTIEFGEADLDMQHLVLEGAYYVQLRVDNVYSPFNPDPQKGEGPPKVEKNH